jgi:hypothetical protein
MAACSGRHVQLLQPGVAAFFGFGAGGKRSTAPLAIDQHDPADSLAPVAKRLGYTQADHHGYIDIAMHGILQGSCEHLAMQPS